MTTCKGCGKEIVWGITNDDAETKIPLDPRPPIYVFLARNPINGCRPVMRLLPEEAMVSHFSVCPKASQF